LASTTSLDFVDSIEVSMSHGTASASGSESSGEEGVDGGHGRACRQAGLAMRVADYQRIESSIAVRPSTSSCQPRSKYVRLHERGTHQVRRQADPAPLLRTANDAPLILGTCIGAETHASYP